MKEKALRESVGFKDVVVYHYCSVEALYGILASKAFWLTSLESTNDSTELKLAKEIIAKAIDELKSENKSTENYRHIINTDNTKNDAFYIRNIRKEKYYGLSLVKDSDSLTHWERYAKNASGVCIGLNVALINNIFNVYGLPDIVTDWLQFIPIEYSFEKQVQYAKSLMINKINGLCELGQKSNILDLIYPTIYHTTLNTLKPAIKHRGFSSEKEYRIYLKDGEAEARAKFMEDISGYPFTENRELFNGLSRQIHDLASKMQVLSGDIRYGIFKGMIRSYYSLNLEMIWSDTLIPEIVLGPKCFQNKNEVKRFIKSCGLYKAKISVSKVPIR